MPTERCYLAGSNPVKIALFLKQANLNDIFYGRGHDLPKNPQTGSKKGESEAELNPEKGVFLGGGRGIGGRSGMHPSCPEGKPRDCDPRIFLRKKILVRTIGSLEKSHNFPIKFVSNRDSSNTFKIFKG